MFYVAEKKIKGMRGGAGLADSPENRLELNQSEINELLPLYKEECIYIREASLHDGVLISTFRTFDYPFFKKTPKHFTRTHALLFVTQASYLMSTILSEQNSEWPLEKEVALLLAEHEQMTFTNMELNFRKFIRNTDGITMELSIPYFKILRKRLYANIEFNFLKGCHGSCKAIVALDGTLKIEE